MTVSQNDLKTIFASANKIIGDMHEASMGRRYLASLLREVPIEAMTILKLIEPHLDQKPPRPPPHDQE